MARWSPAPFVLGPLNGGLKWPRAFHSELVREREWLSWLRSVYRIFPYHRSTFRDSDAILAAFEHTICDVPKRDLPRVFDVPEVGFDPNIFKPANSHRNHARKTILFVGRFVPYKLPQLAVRAFVIRPALRAHRLVMIGDGPERSAVEQLVRSHGLESCVDLLGWKSQAEVATLMREADIFAFPSIRELGAGVVIEAMACGLPCVVVDYGGPGGLISEGRGIKVP